MDLAADRRAVSFEPPDVLEAARLSRLAIGCATRDAPPRPPEPRREPRPWGVDAIRVSNGALTRLH